MERATILINCHIFVMSFLIDPIGDQNDVQYLSIYSGSIAIQDMPSTCHMPIFLCLLYWEMSSNCLVCVSRDMSRELMFVDTVFPFVCAPFAPSAELRCRDPKQGDAFHIWVMLMPGRL